MADTLELARSLNFLEHAGRAQLEVPERTAPPSYKDEIRLDGCLACARSESKRYGGRSLSAYDAPQIGLRPCVRGGT
jgi:hypothetical protein